MRSVLVVVVLSLATAAHADGGLMVTPPAAGTITIERKDVAAGVIEWTLSNGAHVIFKHTELEPKGEVQLAAYSVGGAQGLPKADRAAVIDATAGVLAGGAGDLDEKTLDARLDGKKIWYAIGVRSIADWLNTTGPVENAETMFQHMYLRLTAPRFDPAAWAAWKQAQKDGVAKRDFDDAQQIVQDVLREPGLPHLVTTADIDALDYAKSFTFYRERFTDPSRFTFIVTGAIEADALRPLVETYLAGMPALRHDTTVYPGVMVPRGVVVKRVALPLSDDERKAGARARLSFVFHFAGPWTVDLDRDQRALGFALAERLHAAWGGDAGDVDAFPILSGAPMREQMLGLTVKCAPADVDARVKDVLAQADALTATDLGDDELARVRDVVKKHHDDDFVQNGEWTFSFLYATVHGGSGVELADLDGRLARVTAANLRALAKKLLTRKQYLLVIAVPSP